MNFTGNHSLASMFPSCQIHLIYCLGAEELGELTVTYTLNSPYNNNLILLIVEKFPYGNLTAYARQFNYAAQQANLTVLPNSEVRDAMLAMFLGWLKPYLKYFSEKLWGEWFNGYLPLFLPGINEADITLLPTDVSCVSYQSVISGFNQAYEYLPHSTRLSFYNIYIKTFWNKKVLAHDGCNYTEPIQWVRDNLASFTNQASLLDLLEFNGNLTKVFDSTTLTTKELADFTVILDSLCEPTLLNDVLLQVTTFESFEAIQEYLEYLQDILVPVSTKYLTSCSEQPIFGQLSGETQQEVITSVLKVLEKEWSFRNISQWMTTFSYLLNNFPAAFNQANIMSITLNMSCESYQKLITAMDQVYPRLSEAQRNYIYYYAKSYLTQQLLYTGSACAQDSNDTVKLIILNFGKYYSEGKITELTYLYPNLEIGDLFRMLNPKELAQMLLKEDVLDNYTLMITILRLIDLKNITEYVFGITESAYEANISVSEITSVKQSLLAVILLEENFSSFSTQDWTILFENDLYSLLPYFNQTLLDLIPADITCSSYQAILKVFSSPPIYSSLTSPTKNAIYISLIKRYMSQQLSTADIVCDSGDLRSWVKLNVYKFIRESTFKDLALFNQNLTKVEHPDDLSARELADLTFLADDLQNSTLSTIILNEIQAFTSYEMIFEYLTSIKSHLCSITDAYFNNTSCDLYEPLTQLSVRTRQDLLTNVFTLLQKRWTFNSMLDWLQVFNIIFTDFFDALNDNHLTYLPLSISCEDYQAIMKTLSGVYMKLNKIEIGIIYNYSKSYLGQQQQITEFACANANTDTEEWVTKNLAAFVPSATILELVELFPRLDLVCTPQK
ncbi:uncharacterized protein LOC143786176 [Ranitomeya variabilis]|uniref:uncharacterized protein LOC143786176 n=1 Tax=Ranitomeya variabilis TaxID=490064 RepID=UPI00405608D8